MTNDIDVQKIMQNITQTYLENQEEIARRIAVFQPIQGTVPAGLDWTKEIKKYEGKQPTVDELMSLLGTGAWIALLGFSLAKIALADPVPILSFLGTIAFMEFINEEAIQAATFPVWLMVQNELYDEAANQLDIAENIITASESFVNSIGLLNPLTYQSFSAYNRAARSNIAAFRKIVEKKRRGVAAKRTQQLFDLR